jgi:hypothetical protein
VGVDQDVAELEVAVDDVVLMEVRDRPQDLQEHALDLGQREVLVAGQKVVDEMGQVGFAILEDQEDAIALCTHKSTLLIEFVAHHDLFELHYVFVVQFLQYLDLSQ